MRKTVAAVATAAVLAFAGVLFGAMPGSARTAGGFWLTTARHVTTSATGPTVIGCRSCEDFTVDGVEIGGTPDNPFKSTASSTFGAVSGGAWSKGIVVRNLTIHDQYPATTGQHHEGLFVSNVDGIQILNSRFERIYGNTGDLFFTGFEIPGTAKNVLVRGNYFGRPTNGAGSDAIQWNDGGGWMTNYLIDGNLFDGSQMNFATLKKTVSNFVVGINYGTTPTAAQISAATTRGVQFLPGALPFRPASEWPGTVTPPPTTTVSTTTAPTTTTTPPPPPPYSPACAPTCDEQIADLGKELATANDLAADLQLKLDAQIAAAAVLKAKIDQARAALE